MLRSPVVVTLGHVDHGKTSLLDCIRKTSVAEREPGRITQWIGASEVPLAAIKKTCGDLLAQRKIELKIPGLLMIDTPGHEAFTNLRRRGGSIADIAVLVVDVQQGFQPQTHEALQILREYKTPFIVAANKIDAIGGWRSNAWEPFASTFAKQRQDVQAALDEKVYALVGALHESGFSSERFDRVTEFAKQVMIVPVSAKTGEGVAELLVYLSGLSQKFLEKRLETEAGAGRGSVLEVREEKGLGTVIDVILYAGTMRKNDEVVFATLAGAKRTRVRALLRPKPLEEMREARGRFDYVDEARAACGVRIFAPDLQGALPGSPVLVVKDNAAALADEIEREIRQAIIKTDGVGAVLKADTIGSLEAITRLLKKEGVAVRAADIGAVTKKDVAEARVVRERSKYLGAVLAFNVGAADDALQDAKSAGVPVLRENVIYSLIDDYKKWVAEEKEREKRGAFAQLITPAKMKVLPGYCFRISHPAVFGVEVLVGRIAVNYPFINESGIIIGRVKSIQREKESLAEATRGAQVAVAMQEPVFGRQVREKDVLLSDVPKEHERLLLEKYREYLGEEEITLLEEIRKIKKGVAHQ